MGLTDIYSSLDTPQTVRSPLADKNTSPVSQLASPDVSSSSVATNTVELNYERKQLTYNKQSVVSERSFREGSDDRTHAANTILGFVTNKLHAHAAEGVASEELAVILEEGVSGFISGFEQAYAQLSDMGFLYQEVEAAIESTFTQVLDGVEALAASFGLSSIFDDQRASQNTRRDEYVPAKLPNVKPEFSPISSVKDIQPSTLVSEVKNFNALIEASRFDYRSQTKQSFDFSLNTQDGDRVRIRSAYSSSSVLAGESVAYRFGEGAELSGSVRVSGGFYLDIQGEIDEQELRAIEDLLARVKTVSDTFFAGDLEAAFEKALDIGFDSDEIAQYSLKLRYQYTAQYQAQHISYSPQSLSQADDLSKFTALSQNDESIMLLARFVQALEDMRLKASELGLVDDSQGNASKDVDIEKGRKSEAVEFTSEMLRSLNRLSASELT